jgi:hypothetical protein
MAVVAATRAAIVGAPVFAVDDVGQAVSAGHGAHDDVAAVAAVAAIGTAARYIPFPAETATPAAAVAALDKQGHSIDEHEIHHSKSPRIAIGGLAGVYPL